MKTECKKNSKSTSVSLTTYDDITGGSKFFVAGAGSQTPDSQITDGIVRIGGTRLIISKNKKLHSEFEFLTSDSLSNQRKGSTVYAGDSGRPVLVLEDDGEYRIVGVHTVSMQVNNKFVGKHQFLLDPLVHDRLRQAIMKTIRWDQENIWQPLTAALSCKQMF